MTALMTTASASNSNEHKAHALLSYILMAIGLFTAIPLLIGAIWAMLKKNAALGTIYHSHLVNVTRVFWWSLFWWIVGGIFALVVIGYAVWAVAWLWALYRVVDGLVKILSDQPYPV